MAQHTKQCLTCNKEFTASRSDAIYCSAICRNQANRERGTRSRKVPGNPGGELSLILDELRQIRALMSVQNERVLTIDQVLKEFEISRPTFERYQAEGLFTLYRFGGKDGKGRGKKPYLKYSELLQSLKRDQAGEHDTLIEI